MAIAVVGALVFLQVRSSISLDRHGTLSRQYGAQQLWFSGCSGYWSSVSGFVGGSRLFSSIWMIITTVFITCWLYSAKQWGSLILIFAQWRDHRSVL